MSIRTSPRPAGVPCWLDLMVSDVPAAGFDPPFGRLATLSDPYGAVFCVLQAVPGQPTPDRTG